jgi:CheY-like chemotaxis protein
MSKRFLIVEDEIFVALDMEHILTSLGCEVVGIAADQETALSLGSAADAALVDVNLRDGQTGPEIGRRLANEYGVRVVFVTANPAQLGDGIEGALGVVSKPISDNSLIATVNFLATMDAPPPSELHLFA